jgi:hypothetical protein
MALSVMELKRLKQLFGLNSVVKLNSKGYDLVLVCTGEILADGRDFEGIVISSCEKYKGKWPEIGTVGCLSFDWSCLSFVKLDRPLTPEERNNLIKYGEFPPENLYNE